MGAAGRGRILLVDDDEDSRDFLALALTVRGYQVVQASSADEALGLMVGERYDLVLTDYDMPRKTGAAMLKEARGRGLIRGTPTLVVTAHPEPPDVPGAELIRKPVDVARFLLQIGKLLEQRDPAPAEAPASETPVAVELALYVSRLSPASQRARRNIDALLAGYRSEQVRLEVCDLALRPEEAERDRVIFTPTLVKRSPDAPVWVLGDLSDASVVVDMLSMYGVEAVESPA